MTRLLGQGGRRDQVALNKGGALGAIKERQARPKTILLGQGRNGTAAVYGGGRAMHHAVLVSFSRGWTQDRKPQ